MEMKPGDRVEVLLNRGMADEWCPGTLLDGGRVELDDPSLFVSHGPYIAQPEEITEIRPAGSATAPD